VLASRRGVGTRLIEPDPANAPYTRSSGDPLHAVIGSKPRIVSVTKEPAAPEIGKFLMLANDEPVLKIVRRHEVDAGPLSLVISYMPGSYAAVFTRQALANHILHEILWQKLGLFQKKSTHTIRVARADGYIALQLGIALTDPVMHIRSHGFLEDGRPIRWTDNYFREDRYQYTAEMLWKKPK
jgi:GntR family transcriptional regulator